MTSQQTETQISPPTLQEQIRAAINNCGAENKSDTPDFILAQFLSDCLDAFDQATRTRNNWYQKNPSCKRPE